MNNKWMYSSFLILNFFCLSFLPSCKNKSIPSKSKKLIQTSNNHLPKDLFYNNKPISDECMKQLVPILCAAITSKEIDLDTFVAEQKSSNNAEEQDKYEWHYIGTLPNGDHLIYGYLWPAYAAGKFTEIAIVRRTGNKLKALGWIEGGDRHATMIHRESCKLNGTILTYQRHMTNGLLYEILTNQDPKLLYYAKNKNKEELCWGEAGYIGYGTFQVTITPDAKLKNHYLQSFTLADSDLNIKYYDDWIKKTPQNSLTIGTAINELLGYYSCMHKKDTLTLAQLNDVIKAACSYTKADSETK